MSFDLSADYFSLFDLPVSYSIDNALLTQKYRDLQQVVHPDRFANATEQERRLSLQYTTHLNEAVNVLKDPLARARYLLELKGVQWDDEQSTLSDPAFLMQQMELREALSDVREQVDPLEAVADIISEVTTIIRGNSCQLEEMLESDDQDEWLKAKDQVRKMQFLKKLISEAEAVEAELEDS